MLLINTTHGLRSTRGAGGRYRKVAWLSIRLRRSRSNTSTEYTRSRGLHSIENCRAGGREVPSTLAPGGYTIENCRAGGPR